MQTTIRLAPAGNASPAGIVCGVGAGALWGLVFLAPELARGFQPLDLAIGRYLAFGAISACLIAPRLRTLLPKLGRREWLDLAWLSLAGNTVYYILLSAAVQTGGIAMTSLVIGFLPVAVTIIGSRDRDAVPLRRLALSLLCCVGGAVCIGWHAIAAPTSGSLTAQATGLVCAVGALVSWTSYAVGNSRCLARLGGISVHDWNLLTGLVTGAQAVVLIPVALLVGTAHHGSAAWAWFAGLSIGVAILASIAGNALWNRMSRLLPLTLVGQMILFETLFALLYGFLWEQRLPRPLEVVAFALVALSVVTCIAAHRKLPRSSKGKVAVAVPV
ncbi:DMT family transporter [Methylobacterium durans]|uniref:DMT family transporter n=1 Tax=Methylobacterium durans TaxID=2202825 RepID=UPI002AFF6599|nr:DMT family transporter [Methylobacterium durans]MEA1831426.1 DMT family transporter [Methylobacterium durans]